MARSKRLAHSVLRDLAQTMAFLVTMSALSFAPAFVASGRALAADGDAKAEAREHFQKGLAAYEDERFGEAAEEFEAAYRLSPAFKILYNIGQVNVALGRSVEAVEAFDKYLRQGAATIPADRKREVSAQIEKQLARIGTISIRTFPEAADVRVDGVLVGQTPLTKPVRVNTGKHTVQALLAGHRPATREVEVAGKADIAIEITLEAVAVPAAAAAASAPAKVEPFPAPAPIVVPPAQPIVERVIIETPPASPRTDERQSERVAPVVLRQGSSSVNWQRIGGVVAIVGGLATATIGGVKVYRGLNQSTDARDRLNALSAMDPATIDDAQWTAATADFEAGKTRSREGWTIAGIGAAVFIGGIVLVATAPERSNTVSLASWVTTDSGGVVVRGAW